MNVKYNLKRSVAKQQAKKESLLQKLGFCARCGASEDVVEPKGYKPFGTVQPESQVLFEEEKEDPNQPSEPFGQDKTLSPKGLQTISRFGEHEF